MNLVFMGTGPALPVRGRGKNYRSNSSLLIKTKNYNILIDATPMIEEQMLRNAVDEIHAVLISHMHSDAAKGLPKLVEKFGSLPVYTLKHNFELMHEIWKDLKVEEHNIVPGKPFRVFGVEFVPFRVIHAEPFPTGKKYPCLGFRFNGVLYAGDMEAVPPESEKYFENVDLMIIDAAMYFDRKIRGHMNTEQALQLIKKYNPKKAILTQIGKTYPDHYKVQKRIDEYCKLYRIPTDVKLAYDGMVVEGVDEKNKLASTLSSPSKKSSTKAQLAENERLAIYLVKPHAELIYNNEKKLIVKSRNYKNMLNRPLYLLDNEFCYGIIKLTNVKKIDLKGFEELREKHKITEEERKEWWDDKKEFYAYEFEWVEHFPEPKPATVPKGTQTFVENWSFASKVENSEDFKFHRTLELIQDIYNYNPHNMENEVLADDFRLAVAYYSRILQGKKIKFSKEQVVSLAAKILKEIARRKKSGKMKWTANPEGKSKAYQKLWKEVDLSREERNILLGIKLNVEALRQIINI